jgi:hypothetical protein
MSKFLIKAAAIMAAAGLVLAACDNLNLLGNGDNGDNNGGGLSAPTGLTASASEIPSPLAGTASAGRHLMGYTVAIVPPGGRTPP